MRSFNLCYYLVLVSIILSTTMYSQPEEFPVGAFVGSAPNFPDSTYPSNDENFWQIEQMGLNWVIAVPTENNQDSLNMFNIIAYKPHSATDYIYHYSSAYYTRWEAEEVSEFSTGMKRSGGTIEGEYYTSGSNYTDKLNFLSGPNYAQDKKYKNFYYSSDPIIDYKIRIRYKIDGPQAEQPANVCKITVKYYYRYGKPAVLDSLVIGTYFLTTNDATGNFQNFDEIPAFSYDSLITQYGLLDGKIFTEEKLNYFNDVDEGLGLNIRFDYYGEPQRKLYIDYIEIYDMRIGRFIVDNTTNFAQNIQFQISQDSIIVDTSSGGKLRYWYSYDEPLAIDNHYAYKMVDDILSNNGYPHQRLITAHQPMWNKSLNGDDTMLRFIEAAQPAKYMFDFYPVQMNHWASSTIVKGSFTTLSNLSYLLQSAHNTSPDFFYVPQAHSYTNSSGVDVLRQPTPEELNAQVMLALAHGVKGIFFYKYYSSTDQDAIVELPITTTTPYYYPTTDIYNKIKDDIAPRLKYDLGPILQELEYSGNYIHFITGNSTDDIPWMFEGGESGTFKNISKDYIAYLDLSDPVPGTNPIHFHVGQLDYPIDSESKYFFITNLICISDKSINLTFNPSFTDYENVLYKTIGNDNLFETHLNTSATLIELDMSAGDGELIQVAPVLKYGGNLVYDDTVSTNITLSDNMTIKQNADLSIEAVYTVDSDIYVENGGKIDVKWYYGNIDITTNGSIGFEDWSDCLIAAKTSNLQHPKLIYSANSSPYLSHYKIYKKYGSSAWAFIDTTSLTTYTDLNTTIVQPGGQGGVDVKYKVAAVIVFKQTTEVFTNEVIYPTSGQEIEKRGNGENAGVIPTTFGITQNYPNPFNPTTEITSQVPEPTYVTIKVYDILGDEIAVLVSGLKNAGIYTVRFDATTISRRISSGTYIYRMKAGKFVESKKMIVLK